MDTTTLVVIVVGVIVLTPVLRLLVQRRVVPRMPARLRYKIFATGLVLGVSTQMIGCIVSAIRGKPGVAAAFLVSCILIGGACVLEMRKLSKEF